MHRSLSVLTLLTAPVLAQVPRLVDTIEAPVAYLCLEAMPAAAGAEGRQLGPVQRLLADPSLDTLFRGKAGEEASGATKALALVRGLLARSAGELEIALTGIVPSGGQPLLVLRARLQPAQADSLQLALDRNQLASADRRVGGKTVYHLDRATPATGPGQDVELALVGADLVVANDSSALKEVLEPRAVGTATAKASKVLASEPRFVALRQRLPLAPGALWLYGDWQRLGQRIEGSLGGVPGALMGSSGLGSARAVMASLAPAQADYAATLLLDFDAAPAAGPGMPPPPHGAPPGPPGRAWRSGSRPERGTVGVDGWFAAVEPVAARSLLADLPAGGLGGLVLSVDLANLADRSHDGHHLLEDLARAFDERGVDFNRSVWSRLGSRGTVQLHVGKGGAATEVGAVYTVRTKNKKAAVDLLADVRRAGEPVGLVQATSREVKDAKDKRSVDLLQLSHGRGPFDLTFYVAGHEDSLLLSADADTLVAVVDDLRRAPRQKRGEGTAAVITSIGGENVAGLFDVDLQPLFEQITSAFVGTTSGAGGIDLSALPKRHVGYLDLQRSNGGTTVRVRVLSSR